MSTSRETATEQSPLLSNSSASSSSTLLADHADHPDGHGAKQTTTWLQGSVITVGVGLLIFLLSFNIALFTTIQSPIALELKAFKNVSWFVSIYLIAMTSLTPVAGRFCQIFSPRVYLFVNIIVVMIGLLIVSVTSSLPVFMFGRAVSGAGTAAYTPVALILVDELVCEKHRGMHLGMVNSAYTTGMAVGAILAGALEPLIGWRALFWLQIPIHLVIGVVLLFAIPHVTIPGSKEMRHIPMSKRIAQIDYLGLLTLTSFVVLLLYSLSRQHIHYLTMGISLALLIIFLAVEARLATNPILPIEVLKTRGNLMTCLGTIGFMIGRWEILFYTPIYAISVRDWSPVSAGLMGMPSNFGFAAGGILTGLFFIRRAGSFYTSSVVSYVLFAVTTLILSQMTTATSPAWLYMIMLFLNGWITGAALNYVMAHVLYLAPVSTHILVLPLITFVRQLAGSFGPAVTGGIFARALKSSLTAGYAPLTPDKESLIRHLLSAPAVVSTLSGHDKEVAISGYTDAFRTLYIAGAVLVLLMAVFQAGVGWTAPADEKSESENIRPAEP